MTFEEELQSLEGKMSLEQATMREIGLYLKQHALSDTSFARTLEKENKSLKECYAYINAEIAKILIKKKGMVGREISNDKCYELAIHYYDEDDIDIKISNFVYGEKAIEKAIDNKPKKTEESATIIEKEPVKVKKVKKSKNHEVEGQISLF